MLIHISDEKAMDLVLDWKYKECTFKYLFESSRGEILLFSSFIAVTNIKYSCQMRVLHVIKKTKYYAMFYLFSSDDAIYFISILLFFHISPQ